MPRQRFVQIDGELIPVDQFVQESPKSAMVMGDIQPYQSQVDGRWITSRSAHREHLRAHRLIEVGNETKYLKPYGQLRDIPGRKELIKDIVNQKMR